MFWKLKVYVGSRKDWTSSQKIHPLRVTKYIEPHLAQEVPELKIAGGLERTGGSITCSLCSDSSLGVPLKPPLEAGYGAAWTLDMTWSCLCSNHLFTIHICVLWESNENFVCWVLSNRCKQPEEAITPWLPEAGRLLQFLYFFSLAICFQTLA